MIAVACVAIICAAVLFAQHREHTYKLEAVWTANQLQRFIERIEALEYAQTNQYDHKAFEALRSDLDAVRLAVGIKGKR